MGKDFSFTVYKDLIDEIKRTGFKVVTLKEYFRQRQDSPAFLILRHDVDRRPENALRMALLESSSGIHSTYYFRVTKNVFNKEIIQKIAGLGHEIGYHYEDLSLAKGDFEKAIKSFELNLNKLREFYPVKTICMHGSPLSKYDNKDLWERYDYRDYGIIGEPYFDLDFNKILYLTDIGRRWNGADYSIRDKVKSKFNFNFSTTVDIINATQNNFLPNKVMMTTHPQRWADKLSPWLKELIWQNLKNVLKRLSK